MKRLPSGGTMNDRRNEICRSLSRLQEDFSGVKDTVAKMKYDELISFSVNDLRKEIAAPLVGIFLDEVECILSMICKEVDLNER